MGMETEKEKIDEGRRRSEERERDREAGGQRVRAVSRDS
jgi:hypothetical protein